MARHVTIDALLRRAASTEAAAGRLSHPMWLFGRIRERRFVREIDSFMDMLHGLPQHEAAKVTSAQLAATGRHIEGIIEAVERFLAAHPPSTRDQLERNQRLAGRIYQLRRAHEAISRHTTPNPEVVDLRREEQLRHAHEEQNVKE